MLATDSPAVETRPGDSIPEYNGNRTGDGVILEKVELTLRTRNGHLVSTKHHQYTGTSDIGIENANQVFPASQCRTQYSCDR